MDAPGGGVSSEDEDEEDGTAFSSEDDGETGHGTSEDDGETGHGTSEGDVETGHEAGAAEPRRTPRVGAAKAPGALLDKGIIAPHKRKKRGSPPKRHRPSKSVRAKVRNSESYRKRAAAKKAA